MLNLIVLLHKEFNARPKLVGVPMLFFFSLWLETDYNFELDEIQLTGEAVMWFLIYLIVFFLFEIILCWLVLLISPTIVDVPNDLGT